MPGASRVDDLLQLATDAIVRGADVIGMPAGDGFQALVASVAAQRDVPHVCIPAGTRNHFALDLGLDRDDVARAAGTAYGYSDGWDEGCFRYSGEGRVGDLDFVGGNAATDTR